MLLKWVNEKGKNGQQPPCEIDGTIEVIFKRKTGTGQYGDWSIQGGKINLEDGQISVTFMGCKDLPWQLKGKKISVELRETPKGLAGMKLSVREYINKDGEKVISKSINIKPSALIKIEGKEENFWPPREETPVPQKGERLIDAPVQHNPVHAEKAAMLAKEFKEEHQPMPTTLTDDDVPF